MTLSTLQLAGCPFCGAEAKQGYNAGTEVYPQSFWVQCSSCEANSPSFFGSNTWGGDKTDDERAKAKAASWWNRRPEADNPRRERCTQKK